MSQRILLGAMSGTSADGVDVAAVEVAGRGLGMSARYLGHVERPYDAALRRRIFAVREGGAVRLDELASLGRDVSLAYAAATRELLQEMSLKPSQVSAVAAHGQTLYHAPPNTIQWLDPSLLAAETDLQVVSDFRRADCAAGGQGAPLVPFADWILFRHPTKTRVILNLGGIANLTYLPAGGGIEDVIAFDTGPGCCLSDFVMRTRGGADRDEGGSRATAGTPDWDVANRFVSSVGYFAAPPPKSLDVPELLAAYDRFSVADSTRGLDAELATCAAIVALAVWCSCIDFLPNSECDLDEIIVCGGGVRNRAIMQEIVESPPFWDVTVCEAGPDEVPAQAREAVCFAVLGAATLDGEASNVPAATGASRRVVLGSVTPRPTPTRFDVDKPS